MHLPLYDFGISDYRSSKMLNCKRAMIKRLSNAIDATGRAIRDELIKKYPLSRMLLPSSRQEDAWISAFSEALNGGEIYGSGAVLRKLSLGITKSATGLESDVDLSATAFPLIIDAINRVANVADETLLVLGEDGIWKDMSNVRFKSWIQQPGRSGYIELAIVDAQLRLVDRLSVNLWKQVGDVFECTAPGAPIKKVLKAYSESAISDRVGTTVEPIDVVYTWVNSDDPTWADLVAPYREVAKVDDDRFAQVDELKYSLRSLFAFAPWVRKVFVFSNCAAPDWFNASDRVQWVMHNEVIPERYLPLFNSHSIETFLHEIPGLSERYIYFNDDVFLSGSVRPTDFFDVYGRSVSRMEMSGTIEYLMQRADSGSAEEWQHAAVNCAKLMLQTTGVLPRRLHCHAPHAYTRSIYTELAETFPGQMETTRTARFRQKTDYSFSSFLFHHFALWRGCAAHVDENAMVVRATNYRRFLSKKVYSTQRFFCVNDGGGSARDAGFRQFKETFLSEHYAFKSPAEF